jgi:glycosyltransferase involved in cell wall biosynthesis
VRILICTTQVPFTSGGAEAHVANLRTAFIEHGHDAEIVAMPFQWNPPAQIVNSMLLWRMLDLTHCNGRAVDLVVGMKFPAYLVRHPHKVLWVLHQHKQAYELLGTEFGDLHDDEESQRVKDIIVDADTRLIPEAKRVFANSRTVAERMYKYNGIRAEPLYHPSPRAAALRCNGYGDYVFYPSRLDRLKRQEILIQAMAQVQSAAKCVLAGTGPEEEKLRDLVARLDLQERVKILGFVSDQQMDQLYADALAVYFGPFAEDYGYVTLEAFQSKKPVLTLEDSGGPIEFVHQGENGFIVPADPGAIADKIDLLFDNRKIAAKMGERGCETVAGLKLSWDNVVSRLLS